MAFEYVVQHPRLLDHRDCAGRTPLMKAAQQGASRHVVALLAARADPNMRGGNGWTVLHYAAVSSCAELCDILIDQPRFPWRPSRTKRRRCSTCAAARGRSRDPVPTKPALEAYTEPSTLGLCWATPHCIKGYYRRELRSVLEPPSSEYGHVLLLEVAVVLVVVRVSSHAPPPRRLLHGCRSLRAPCSRGGPGERTGAGSLSDHASII